MARSRAEAETLQAVTKADTALQILDRVSLAEDSERTYLLDSHRGSIIAINHSSGQLIWEMLPSPRQHDSLIPLSASMA